MAATPTELHELAVNAESVLEKLSTGLAQAGADEQTVSAVTQMADLTRQLVVALGRGQERTGDTEPPAAPVDPAAAQAEAEIAAESAPETAAPAPARTVNEAIDSM